MIKTTNNNTKDSLVEVHQSSEFGRYLVASKDIEELSVVLKESPLIFGAGDDGHEQDLGKFPMCLGCSSRIDQQQNWNKCSKCFWPVCGKECEQLKIHSENECSAFFQSSKSYHNVPNKWPVINKSILTLRCFLLKQKDPVSYKNIILALEHHTEIRKLKHCCVEEDEMILRNLEYFLGRELQNDAEQKEIINIIGVITCNAFSSTNSDNEMTTISQCIYPTASLFANGCLPNCSWKINSKPHFDIVVRSASSIKKGDMLLISYSPQDTFSGTLQRQVANEEVAHFYCACERCKDPTEMGTNLSAVKCPLCTDNNILLSQNPLLPESTWICQSKNCDESQSVNKVFTRIYKIQQTFEKVKNKGLKPKEEFVQLEQLMLSAKEILHSNHFLFCDMKMYLVKKLVPILDFLNEEELQSLINYTNDLLAIADVLAPGFSHIRSLLQHYLAQELKMKLKRYLVRRDEHQETEIKEIKKLIQDFEKKTLLFLQCYKYNN